MPYEDILEEEHGEEASLHVEEEGHEANNNQNQYGDDGFEGEEEYEDGHYSISPRAGKAKTAFKNKIACRMRVSSKIVLIQSSPKSPYQRRNIKPRHGAKRSSG